MTIAVILAGGCGSRMGADRPKQYLDLCGKPVIFRTAEPFLRHKQVDQVIILVPEAWLNFTKEVFEGLAVTILPGGSTRSGTLRRALGYIKERHGQADPILLTHDAARPFVTEGMISENIAAAALHGACGTVVPAGDTILQSRDGAFISQVPPRREMYQAQTPQSFRCSLLRELMNSLAPEEEAQLTDACSVFTLRGRPVALVTGDVTNGKITYPYDLQLARVLFLERKKAQKNV